MIYMAATVVALITGMVWASRLWSSHKVEEGVLVVKNGTQETSIPTNEIIEVFEIDQVSKDASFFEKYIIRPYVKKERIAVYTRSNVSYFFILRNPNRLVKAIKAQNPQVFIKAKVM
ncbi:hypothetical protein [Domibacillus robiginosus]|uniref:hypothetical protein n=1 Tax=Domibacillus robiginosus TaxID=1071054 RepID=UPI00067D7D0D|nr:hypothetical protein [Domibacillus robiginosus]